MSESPLRSISMYLCVLLASLVFAIASPAFADEPGDEPVAALSDLAPEPALDRAADLSAIENLERQMDRALMTDVSRMLDGIVSDRTDQQMRWLEQHYFDGATAGGRVSPGAAPVALVSPANSR
jgi:hypothetical protein